MTWQSILQMQTQTIPTILTIPKPWALRDGDGLARGSGNVGIVGPTRRKPQKFRHFQNHGPSYIEPARPVILKLWNCCGPHDKTSHIPTVLTIPTREL